MKTFKRLTDDEIDNIDKSLNEAKILQGEILDKEALKVIRRRNKLLAKYKNPTGKLAKKLRAEEFHKQIIQKLNPFKKPSWS